MMEIRITKMFDLTEGIDALVSVSEQEGYSFVRRFYDEWRSGKNRFNRSGEVIYSARDSMIFAGICGLNCDPYVSSAGVGRLRHLYVHPQYRGHGVAKSLVDNCLVSANVHFEKVRLRTSNEMAARLYRSIGFQEVTDPTSTHELYLAGHQAEQ